MTKGVRVSEVSEQGVGNRYIRDLAKRNPHTPVGRSLRKHSVLTDGAKKERKKQCKTNEDPT